MTLTEAVGRARRTTCGLLQIADREKLREILALQAELLVREARVDAMLELVEEYERDGRLKAAAHLTKRVQAEADALNTTLKDCRSLLSASVS